MSVADDRHQVLVDLVPEAGGLPRHGDGAAVGADRWGHHVARVVLVRAGDVRRQHEPGQAGGPRSRRGRRRTRTCRRTTPGPRARGEVVGGDGGGQAAHPGDLDVQDPAGADGERGLQVVMSSTDSSRQTGVSITACSRAARPRSRGAKGCSIMSSPFAVEGAQGGEVLLVLGVGAVRVDVQLQVGNAARTAATGSTSHPGAIFSLTRG